MMIDKNIFRPRPICHVGGTQIGVIAEPAIEPGHQWIVIENTQEGRGLALILAGDGDAAFQVGNWIVTPHNADAARLLNDLLAAIQEIQRAAPVPVQRLLFEECVRFVEAGPRGELD